MWSKQTPKIPGFYWCCQNGNVRMVKVWAYRPQANDDCLYTNEDGGVQVTDPELYSGSVWSGPIEPPAPPSNVEAVRRKRSAAQFASERATC